MTTRTPSFSGSMRGRSSHSAQFRRRVRRNPGQRGSMALVLFVVVDRPLGLRGKPSKRLLPFRDLLSQPAFGKRQRGLALRFGLRLDQVGEPFRLGQIDPAVLERAAGEFPGSAARKPSIDRQAHQEPRRRPPGRRGTGILPYLRRSNSPANRTAGPRPRRAARRDGMAQLAHCGASAPPAAKPQSALPLHALGTADTNDRDRRRRAPAGQREDGVRRQRPQVNSGAM